MAGIAAGLEIKVAFGDVWKESLSEMSGGQRSLLALSLILAMLLFKPAPIYILDEVHCHRGHRAFFAFEPCRALDLPSSPIFNVTYYTKASLSCQVDAALDLSHTQNIGHVLKHHFAKSQFLVVCCSSLFELVAGHLKLAFSSPRGVLFYSFDSIFLCRSALRKASSTMQMSYSGKALKV